MENKNIRYMMYFFIKASEAVQRDRLEHHHDVSHPAVPTMER